MATLIQQMIAEREALGELRGVARGEARGGAKLLLHQVRWRFGPVPAETEARVRDASATELEAWGEAILEAQSLEDLFTNGRSN